MASTIDRVFETHARVVEEGYTKDVGLGKTTYAISNLRGGVGKSTLSFNIAYELAQKHPLLVADMCPQRNLTETFLHGVDAPVTILDALQPAMLGPAFGVAADDISLRISKYCDMFKKSLPAFFIAGDAKLFAFPSTMYQQLQIANAQENMIAIKNLLFSLKTIITNQRAIYNLDKAIIDTSPFYGGGTHLSWCTADALIVPVRVDEHSIESLELTLNMLDSSTGDFNLWNERAGITEKPVVAAVVMTMTGAKGKQRANADNASKMYIEKALKICDKYKGLFSGEPADSFVITDDFVSTGRISGAKSIPISELKIGSFHSVEGKRLQVNGSADRYKKELKYLVSIL